MQDTIAIDVKVLGPKIQVTVNGELITNWGGSLVFSMFILTIDRCRHYEHDVFRNRGTYMRRGDYFTTLWPDLNLHEATNIFHVTKRKMRGVLERKAGVKIGVGLTKYVNDLYILSNQFQVSYDVDAFEVAYNAAMDDYHNQAAWQAAKDLYQGPFLAARRFNDPFSTWVEQRQKDIQAKMIVIDRRLEQMNRG